MKNQVNGGSNMEKNLRITKLNPKFFDQNPYPILEFTFSQCPNNKKFLKNIRMCLNRAIEKYKLPMKMIPMKNNIESLIGDYFNEVAMSLEKKLNKPIIITIDESDQPILNQMFDEYLTEIDRIKQIDQTIKSFNIFYGNIKDMNPKHARNVIIPGHSMISNTTIYSGFILFNPKFLFVKGLNNAIILKDSLYFHNLLGFTRDEIKINYKFQIEKISKTKGVSEEDLLNELTIYYNGYKYHNQAQNNLYNAHAIQKYFANDGELKNYFAAPGSTNILFNCLKHQNVPDIINYLNLISDQEFKISVENGNF